MAHPFLFNANTQPLCLLNVSKSTKLYNVTLLLKKERCRSQKEGTQALHFFLACHFFFKKWGDQIDRET